MMNVIKLLKPKCSVAFLTQDQTVRQGIEKIKYHGYTAIPVIDSSGIYIGTVTEGDFLWKLISAGEQGLKALERISIKDIIRKDWNTPISITATTDDIILKLSEQNFVPVVDDRKVFIGIITRKDFIKAYFNKEWNYKKQIN